MSKAIVVNMFGGPGAGKSTLSAYVFAKLKFSGVQAELVTEYAKDLVWDNSAHMLQNQIYLFGEQHQRINRLLDKVDVVIADGSLLLSVIYGQSFSRSFQNLVIEEFEKNYNINIFIDRTEHFTCEGRAHNLEQSKALDADIKSILRQYGYEYHCFRGDENGGNELFEFIKDQVDLLKAQ